MLDMMYNAKDVPLETILKRQALLGGADLLSQHTLKTEAATKAQQERSTTIANFYAYCKENADNYASPYSVWLQSRDNAGPAVLKQQELQVTK